MNPLYSLFLSLSLLPPPLCFFSPFTVLATMHLPRANAGAREKKEKEKERPWGRDYTLVREAEPTPRVEGGKEGCFTGQLGNHPALSSP